MSLLTLKVQQDVVARGDCVKAGRCDEHREAQQVRREDEGQAAPARCLRHGAVAPRDGVGEVDVEGPIVPGRAPKAGLDETSDGRRP
eukprot:1653002-Heterocapsa_arctica.AAC.1